MSTTTRRLQCTPDDVQRVLSDGWSLAHWVVGAARVRDVDAGWPAPGTAVHHSVGIWPLLINDTTSVELRDDDRLVLRARAWPSGEAVVDLRWQREADATLVTMHEDARKGPARLVWKPLRDAGLHARNSESLRRLAYLVEGGSAQATSA